VKLLIAQEVIRKHGCDRDRREQRGQDRDDVGDAERREEAPLNPRKCKQWDEDQDDDRGRINNTGADFLARGRNHLKRRLRVWQFPVFLKPSQDVFDVDDGVIDEFANRNRQTAERHGVDRQPEILEHENRDQDRDRDRGQRDDGRAPVHEEQDQDDGDDGCGFQQHDLDVADRGFDGPVRQAGLSIQLNQAWQRGSASCSRQPTIAGSVANAVGPAGHATGSLKLPCIGVGSGN
jgi:hypothetical protein